MKGRFERGGEMKRRRTVLLVVLLLVLPALGTACGGSAGEESAEPQPAVAEPVKGTDQVRVVMTEEAARRIGIKTVKVRSDGQAANRTVIPYSAVLYDPDGKTWTYTNPKPLVYLREDIEIARIDGNTVVLSKGPPAGAQVVSVGSTEIWGVEYGGIEED